ncbi:MAG: hypothetical protein WA738_06940 [Candidatus Angelobacter sp.]
MKTLLNGRFAPLSHQVGFLSATLDQILEVFLGWQSKLGAEIGEQPTHTRLSCSLAQALMCLDPLTTPPTKVVLIETRSRWTAFFNNGLKMSDPESPVGYLCSIIPCEGVVAHCSPDRSKMKDPSALRIYGIVSFRLFTTHPTDWLNQERAVVAMNDGGTWLFSATGKEQPFEESRKYAARRIVERFTDDMLERYCEALDIKLFDEAFYGRNAVVVKTIQKLKPGSPIMSLEEAQRHTVNASDHLTS